jgi:hypothetical protein
MTVVVNAMLGGELTELQCLNYIEFAETSCKSSLSLGYM